MDMSKHNRRSGHRVAIAAVMASLGLLAAACSSDSPSAVDSTAVVSTAGVSTTEESTSTSAVTTSVVEPTTTTVAKATTTTAPKATLAEPPLPSSTLPAISIYIPGGLIPGPTVKTLTAQTSFTCVQAAQANFVTKVTWTTSGADHVGLVKSGGGSAWSRKPDSANGNVWVSIGCGDTTYLKVTPYSAGNVAGASKTIAITVSSS